MRMHAGADQAPRGLGQSCACVLMLPNHQESLSMFKERVQNSLDALLHDHADHLEFVDYFRKIWGHKLGMLPLVFTCWHRILPLL